MSLRGASCAYVCSGWGSTRRGGLGVCLLLSDKDPLQPDKHVDMDLYRRMPVKEVPSLALLVHQLMRLTQEVGFIEAEPT